MYLMVETIRVQTEDDRPEWIVARETFKNELGGSNSLLYKKLFINVIYIYTVYRI